MSEFDPVQPGAAADGTAPGGSLLALALAEHEIHTVFALPGGHILGFLDACQEVGIRVVDVRHEGSASLAALGWALATGQTGVAAVTAGPGFGNALTGFMDASLGNTPLLLIAGRTGVKQALRGAVMDIDQRSMVAPIATWAQTCTSTDAIPTYAAEALHAARSGRPGAAYLEIPQDVLMGNGAPRMPAIPRGHPETPRSSAPPEQITRALMMLEEAERPIIVAGSGAHWANARAELSELSHRGNIPVTTTSAARGLLTDDECLGSLVHGGLAVGQADLVLILGSAFNANLMYGQPPLFGDKQGIIQVDIDPGRIGGERMPTLGLAGDVRAVCRDLVDGWSAKRPARRAWLAQTDDLVRFGVAMWDQQIASTDTERLHAGWVARELASFAAETGQHTFVADGGDALSWGLAYGRATGPGRLLSTTTALGTLGVGLPFAIAAAAARPQEPVFCFIGDGSFGLSAMEFDSAVRHGLPIIAVVSNNYGWRDVSHEQDAWFGPGRHVASELGDSDYEKIAEAFGGHGEVVEEPDDLRPALKRCMDAGVPSIVNARTDPGVLSDLLRNMGSLGLM